MSIANVARSNYVSSSTPNGGLAAEIESAALTFNKETINNRYVADNIRVMCASKEFTQNPTDALLNWLINGFAESSEEGDSEELALRCLMQCIPHFEEAITVEYLEAFGARYFAQSSTRDQSLDILRKLLSSSNIQTQLERAHCFYARAKAPEEGFPRRYTYTEAAKTDLEIPLQAFRHAQKLRTDEIRGEEEPE